MPTTGSQSRHPLGASLLLGAIFLAAFIATCALEGRFLPFPEVSTVRQKMDFLARHGDDYDVLFIGSSHIQFQVLPSIFDRVAAADGVPVKSFNAGIPAMTSPEDSYVLEQILRRPHRRLRWVFIELWCPEVRVWGEDTSRFAYWHDGSRFALLYRLLRRDFSLRLAHLRKDRAATFADRWAVWSTMAGKLSAHLRAWLTRAINLSRGSDVLTRALQPPGWQDDLRGSLGDFGDGWVSAGRRSQEMTPPMRQQYDRELAERLAHPAVKDRADSICQSALERIVTMITGAGATPVFIIPPTTVARNFYPTEEREKQLTILDYSDVQKYPALFQPEHRMDLGHVNTTGAELFTEVLAHRFVELAKGTAPP